MNKEQFIELAEKISAGIANEAELNLFNNWYYSFRNQPDSQWIEEELGDKKKIEAILLKRINQHINNGPKRAKGRVTRLSRIAAAVVLFVLSAAAWYWWQVTPMDGESTDLVFQNDVEPGGDRAVLTLGDGTQILLNEANTGIIATEGNTSIHKSGEGMITYDAYKGEEEGSSQKLDIETITFNSISTPGGGQYKVVLPDGSEVWLNALSSIRFPTRFIGAQREVEITGEAYFEVKSNTNQPFWVRSGDQVVKVLGTRFNLQAYFDEGAIRTTLLEGSVSVKSGSKQVQITPGQQVINNLNENLKVKEVDAEQAVAWKNGLFQFWNTELEEIMRQLSRWYKIEVEYVSPVYGRTFTGFISRDVTISNVLKMLEEAGDVRFGVEGNLVLVKMEKAENE